MPDRVPSDPTEEQKAISEDALFAALHEYRRCSEDQARGIIGAYLLAARASEEPLSYDELEQERDRLARELFHAQERLIACEPRGECPVCGGETDHVDTCEVGILERQLAEARRWQEHYELAASDRAGEVADLQERVEDLEAALRGLLDSVEQDTRSGKPWVSHDALEAALAAGKRA